MEQLLVCGKNSVIDAYNNNQKIKLIYISKKENLKYFNKHRVDIKVVDHIFLNSLTKENHQGFIAVLPGINYLDIANLIKNKPENVLVLDKIQDPHNLGAIIRTANAAGIKDIILPKTNAAQLDSTALKISSGGYVGINFYRVNSISAALTKIRKSGYWIYSTTLNEKAVPHTKVNYNSPTVIVVGNEGAGISKSVASVSDEFVYINQFGTVQSLNVSVATGIILFDLINKK
ncbi:23S rRNA (guanosine(2251)-2'-O)-methyltransferase RlmB [Mycoplasma sp. OR1901]|uniref:23S rRNA (guanosine(2251)-2'-O)-methyltransferase RlmB n=1 Tax=Mycoplasma sp. OR1901 TaxID=2742195 RepID=UPI0015828D8A|nr:23S rRNA (guanosine(2251)-2'-O)-methyltransferase RlmB [Mycoplasma sp. OR1901]QKT05522.1 23S rRNA (guanosine(2251)-2'-O)-methyltransferase RlmB [Mycoplasma sp. OR1901]